VLAALKGNVKGKEASVAVSQVVSGIVLMLLLAGFFTYTSLWAMALCAAGPLQISK